MSIFYQPMSSSSDIPNCLTPNNNLEDQFSLIKLQLAITTSNNNSTSSTNTTTTSGTSSPGGAQPLSPPLSPYQRNATLHLIKQPLPILPKLNKDNKSYLQNSNAEFKLENFNDYKLTVNIKSVDKSYYGKQLDFLNKYSTLSSSEKASAATNASSLPPRKYRKRLNYDSNDEITPSDIERVRTRRVVKTTNKDLTTDDEAFTSLPSTPPPKKKKRTTTSSPSIPILTLQQQLIDESIPDYSPDVSTLPPKNAKCLKIEWKGQPMDLSNDPNLHKLTHPAEITLASILRLPVAVYLDSKRRFFYEKVNRIRSGKTFRRTDAQKACRIDVNKASRLFAAFEKVGWLNDELFEKYL
ncbi:hypothetical protein Cantr_04498 [Candida viswanathii]|uniref:SWIRM domain-containing protein n=1 Tax=Candida viswanathii TaxID=5486 RepID=A0A367XM29_9ASCO|nr:hypothetical protein Cantr_04498 [Candida viswanathii]